MENQNIICIASATWDSLWVNSQHVMSRLSQKNRVLYIESTGLRSPSGNKSDFQKITRRIKNLFSGIRQVNPNLYIVPPCTVPQLPWGFVRNINNIALRTQLTLLKKRLKLENPILWIFLPTGTGLVGHLGEKLVIYHCVDDYSANPMVNKQMIREMEIDLLQKANLVFTTSNTLYESKKAFNPNTFYLPNVADVDFFAKAAEDIEIPTDICHIPKPIIGYIGNISNYKVNIPLISHLAEMRPHWSFVLIGPVGIGDPLTDVSALTKHPNIHLLGPRPYHQLPAYLKAFDICTIPFHNNESTASSYPMKFNEYLAAGKKIVCTPLPSLRGLEKVAYFADTPEGFCQQMEIALQHKITPAEHALRSQFLRDSSWNKRMADISNLVLQSLNKATSESRQTLLVY